MQLPWKLLKPELQKQSLPFQVLLGGQFTLTHSSPRTTVPKGHTSRQVLL